MKNNEHLIDVLISWIDKCNEEAYSISVGHGRSTENIILATELADSWLNTKKNIWIEGGFILNIVDWPETAASWLAQAKKIGMHSPDAWVIISSPASGIEVLKRLSGQTKWSAAQTFCLFDNAVSLLMHATNLVAYDGLKCITEEGKRWVMSNGKFLQLP